MYKRGILYRKAYYLKRRNMRTISSCVRFLSALLIIIPVAIFILSRLGPVLQEAALRCVSERIDMAVEETVEFARTENDSYYRLAAGISNYLEERFQKPESIDISTPVGNITGFGLLYGRGPLIKARIISICRANVECVCDEYDVPETGMEDEATIKINIQVSFKGFLVNGNTERSYFVRYFIGSTGELFSSTSK